MTAAPKRTLSPELTEGALARLSAANGAFTTAYPGEPSSRQPVHTVYGGAHLWTADSAAKLGALARASLREYAPDFVTFAKAIHLPGADTLPTALADVATLD